MNIQEYIASGKLELYVLDLLPPTEAREVQDYAARYPEIAAEIKSLEMGLEDYAQLHAIPPPPSNLDRIMARIKNTITPTGNPGKTGGIGSAIPWIGLAIATALALWLFSQNSALKRQLVEQDAEFERLQSSCAEIEAANILFAQQLEILENPENQPVILAGSDLSPNSSAIVRYNSTDGKTYFTAENLPPAPAGKQYQLWALVDGAPTDMGVIALDIESDAIIEVPHIESAGAFAITLEDEGGKPGPDLSQLYVIGNVCTAS